MALALVRSIGFSLLASVVATALVRRLLSASGMPGNGASGSHAVVVVVPIVLGNSNNRIGYVKEVHNHSLFGRTRG